MPDGVRVDSSQPTAVKNPKGQLSARASGDVFFDIVGATHKESLVAVPRYLINGVAADRARFKVIEHFEFFIEI